MFTGIITHTGEIAAATRSRITIRAGARVLSALRIGGSIAVDGVCVTVVSKTRGTFSADIMEETARRTTLGSQSHGALVNLELPATPASFLAGHLVQGHVDGVGVVTNSAAMGADHILFIRVPRTLSRFLVVQGSIAINGISLTIVRVRGAECVVSIIPHTWNNTTIRHTAAGSRVNVEVDVLAKYVDKYVRMR